MEGGGEHDPVGAAIGGPALDLSHEHASHTASAHVGGYDERSELRDRARLVEDVARVHRGKSDDATVDNRHQRVRVAARAHACEACRDVGRRRWIAEVAEQLRERRRVVVARGPDVDHLSTGATVARQSA